MSRHTQPFLRALLGLMLAVGALQPLRAQLDPRLQNSHTDFLDLYQQSSSLQARPEIATIFDCSGSMDSLMYHPLYVNNDTQDADDYRYMVFTLTPKTNGATTPAGNVYKITAATANGCGNSSTMIVTVNNNNTATFSAPSVPGVGCPNTPAYPTYTVTATAAGNASATTTIQFQATTTVTVGPNTYYTGYHVVGGADTTNNGYSFETAGGATAPTPVITSSASASIPYGTAVTLTVYLSHTFDPENPTSKFINWTTNGGSVATPGGCTGTSTGSGCWKEQTTDSFYQSVTTFTLPSATFVPNPTQLKPLEVLSNVALGTAVTYPYTCPTGTVVTLNDYFVTPGTSTKINWSTANNNGATYIPPADIVNPSPTPTTPLPPGTAYDAASENVTWTVPPYNTTTNTTGGTAGYVTVTLDMSQSAYMAAQTPAIAAIALQACATNGAAGYEALRKPDGTAVTNADANAVTGTLYGSGQGEMDVRNWIRAASHVRFLYKPTGTATTWRTIDVPIPWKNTTPNPVTSPGTRTLSTGVPLASTTLLDQEVVVKTVNGQTVTTTYGSGGQIELDQTYKIEGISSGVFSAHANASDFNGNPLTNAATNAVYLSGVVYRPAYMTWLFTGKYQNSTTLPYYNAAYTGKYIVFDAVANIAQVGGQGAIAWGAAYGPTAVPWGNISISQYNSAGTYTGSANLEASTYTIPALTRLQAVKSAAIGTWINHQADVYWGFRELDPAGEAQAGNATQINDSSSTTITAAAPIPPTTRLNGNDSGWTILNNYLSTDSTTAGAGTTTVTVTSNAGGHSLNGMARISYLFAHGETPLTYAMARTLAQYEDPSSVFNVVEGANVSQCVNSFLLLFTDGIDNNGASTNNPNNTTPYIHADPTNGNALTLFALDGNHQVIQNTTNINPTGLVAGVPTAGPWWNIFTLAGIAAHLSDTSLGVSGTDFLPQGAPPGGLASPSAFLPFAIGQRGDVGDNNLTNFSKPHRVTVMTVGVSLGGTTTNGPKQNLFWTAICGDPATNTGALTTFHTFIPPTGTYPGTWVANDWVTDPQDPTDYPTVGQRAPGAVYYFDATNPTLLSQDMNYAFMLAIGTPSNNATSNPELPFVGASLGQETYLGSFQPPIAGGVIWPGDLEMFATRSVNGQVSILDKNANVATTLNAASAQWSAASAMNARVWSARKLYTRLPSTSAVESPIYPIAPIQWTSAQWTNAAQSDPIFGAMNASLTLPAQKAVLQFAAGGDTSTVTAPNPPATSRSNIMGDIIDSAPAALQYNFTQVSGGLTSRLSSVGGNTFRLILVGTNQGWLQAFGEVTKTITDPNGDGKTITSGDVDELWAFMPTDFLAHLDYLTVPNNTHRYMVDGSPTVYFLDLPVSGAGPGNGVVDSNERAVVVFGLGKGGRSYYALDVTNPYTPTLLWSLVPDEAANFPTGRIVSGGPSLGTVQAILANFGYSTSTPSIGRVTFNGVLHDAVFIGGGLSEPEVEANFGGNKLGRSVIALDVYSGQVLGAVDLTSANIGGATVGPVGTGLVPFEFIVGSAMAQRAYFVDYAGGLWAWGSKAVSGTAPFVNFREDTSEVTSWSIRKVFQDDDTAASGLGARYSTPPAPFVVGSFQGPALTGQSVPAAVGIAMVSGDRNNPLDRNYYTTPAPGNISPIWHQLTVVFDRQDSRGWGLDTLAGPDTGIQPGIGTTNLLSKLPTTPVLTTPGTPCSDPVFSVFTAGCSSNPNYYLGTTTAPKYGYYLPFPSISSGFIPKGINPPTVVAGSLFYSYFTPTASNPCTGGSGNTTSWLIADVMNPIVNDQRPGMSTPSGMRDDWSGVASNYIAIGTNSVLQGGTVPVANPLPGAATTTPQIHTTPTPNSTLAPKVRVWRKVQ